MTGTVIVHIPHLTLGRPTDIVSGRLRWTERWHRTALQRMGVIDVVDDVITVPESLRFAMLNAVGAIIASMSAFRR